MLIPRRLPTVSLIALLAPAILALGTIQFPGESWEWYGTPEEAGFSAPGLAKVRQESENLNTEAVMIIHRGRVVDAWGDLERKFECHSLRKSFLSALYGIQAAEGRIDLEATLRDLGIDDNEPLSETEKQATVRMLLKARSGVYHPALYETAAMAARRPARHSHAPDTFYYYNNWDFNALGTIYEQETGEKIHESFANRIARPIGMEDFEARDGRYVTGSASRHAAYPFQMSARDLARFGLLFLSGGEWAGEQVIPPGWVAESTASYSDTGDRGGYGYMWWIAVDGQHFSGIEGVPDGTYTGRGAGGHVLAVVPSHDLVMVHRVDTFQRGRRVAYEDVGRLLMGVLASAETGIVPAGLVSGEGTFEYEDSAIAGLRMPVHYHAPASIGPETPVWFVIHGAGRNAVGYRDGWLRHIRDENALVLLPEFSQENFPGSATFNLGNIHGPNGERRPEELWSYSIIERLFDHVRKEFGLEADGYQIYGHSAGSQFVHRMLFLLSETRAEAAYLANAGWYTMPQTEIDFPYGLGGMPVSDERLASIFQLPVVVLLGDRDTDPEHHQLRRSRQAMAQGPHRFARGQTFYEAARLRAASLGVPFAWRLEVVEGVAHSNTGMARAAARLMRDSGG